MASRNLVSISFNFLNLVFAISNIFSKLSFCSTIFISICLFSISAPLSESFKEGFKLLSRKSERLEDVKINPDSYKMTMKMRGFEGNWLDRDLSATEKQHVGLALLYALRKVGNKAYPVIIDTPTSRMDRDHKGWSVTRFYPALSHQVIVLATSDDLGDGLYEELKETRALGCELLIKETTENSVTVEMQNLSNFFKVK